METLGLIAGNSVDGESGVPNMSGFPELWRREPSLSDSWREASLLSAVTRSVMGI